MMRGWKPDYPGQIEPLWVWWMPDEPEDGLLGFHTKKDRDSFSQKKPGPFRRRIAADGKTISQTETWGGMIARLTQEASR